MLTVGPYPYVTVGPSTDAAVDLNQLQAACGSSIVLARTYSEEEYKALETDRDYWRQAALKLLEKL